MRDACQQRADCGHFLALLQRLALAPDFGFVGAPRGKVAKMCGEDAPPRHAHLCDSELDREYLAIGAHPLDVDPPSEDARLAAFDVTGKALYMTLTQRGRHDQLGDRPSECFGAAVAERGFCGGVELDDIAGLVDRDDAIEGRRDDRGVERLARGARSELFSERLLAQLQRRQVAIEDKIAGDIAIIAQERRAVALQIAPALAIFEPAFPGYDLAGKRPLALRIEGREALLGKDLLLGVAEDLGLGLAREFDVVPVHIDIAAVAIEQRHPRGNGLERGTELGLADHEPEGTNM